MPNSTAAVGQNCLAGTEGFESPTTASQRRWPTRLGYAPMSQPIIPLTLAPPWLFYFRKKRSARDQCGM